MKIAMAKAKRISRSQDFSSNASLNLWTFDRASVSEAFCSFIVKRTFPSTFGIRRCEILSYQTQPENSNGLWACVLALFPGKPAGYFYTIQVIQDNDIVKNLFGILKVLIGIQIALRKMRQGQTACAGAVRHSSGTGGS